uniref:PTS lactose/cellobiose transporter subunit IIA n=1 Tax=Candidatus Enterococcus willemsii TaxID=1857215 RepID=UPI00403FC008
MVSESTIQKAMQIILFAGDARKNCMEALKAIERSDFVLAKEKMRAANDQIVQAHRVQTDAISAETSGEAGEYSVLFAHAQDTLMTIYSEINIAKRMITIFETYEERMQRLEKNMEGRENNE